MKVLVTGARGMLARALLHELSSRGHEAVGFGLACAALEIAGVAAQLEPCGSGEFVTAARRPMYSVLDCSGTYEVTARAPHWREALAAVLVDGMTNA